MTTPDPTLDSVIAGALAVLAAWARDPSPDSARLYQTALNVAGGEPAIVIVATREGVPELHIAIRTDAGIVVPIVRAFDATPTGETLQ